MATSKHQWTDEQDAIVRQIFSTTCMKARRDATRKLIPKLGAVGRYEAYYRAVKLGCLCPIAVKAKVWSVEEEAILEAYSHLPVMALRQKLANRGFVRSAAAIVKRRLDISGTFQDARVEAGVFSAGKAGEMLGCTSQLVIGYINRGWLKAKKCSDHRTGMYDIKAKDLREFIRDHPAYWMPEKILDKYAFIDLVLPRGRRGDSEKP